MAYKFQNGLFMASGAVDVANDLSAEAGSVLAGDIAATSIEASGSSAITVDVAGAGGILMQDVSASHGLVIRQTDAAQGAEQFLLHERTDGSNVAAAMMFGSGSNTTQLFFRKSDNGTDKIYGMELRDTSGDVQVKGNGTAALGEFSGSGNFQFGGNMTVAGSDLTLGGDLIVNGSTTILSASNVTVDKVLTINSGEATQLNVTGSSFIFGDGASAAGARIKFASGSSEGFHFAFRDGSDSAAIAGHANLVGDGSELSNVGNADSLALGVVVKDARSSAAADDKTLQAGKINIISQFDAGTSDVDLPAISGLSAGNIISVKFNANDLGASKDCTITANGSDTISIDGETSIRINSPHAAIDFVYLGVLDSSGSFAIL